MDALVIDDEQDICDIIASIVRDAGYRAVAAADASEAARAASQNKPALLICDVTMPGKDGLQLLEELKSGGLAHGIVMLTAHAESSIVVQALQLGAIDYIVKPFASQNIVDRLPGWIEMGRRLREVASGAADGEDVVRRLRMIELFRLKNRRLASPTAS